MTELANKRCIPCEGGVPTLSTDEIRDKLAQLTDWRVNDTHTQIFKVFEFKNYGRTMAFANAVAYIAMREGHHPELNVSYNRCVVHYTTHAVDGLTENDFICAAKVDQLAQL
jgi:4a-hydroxytetrahydrobiopterin dehydratase